MCCAGPIEQLAKQERAEKAGRAGQEHVTRFIHRFEGRLPGTIDASSVASPFSVDDVDGETVGRSSRLPGLLLQQLRQERALRGRGEAVERL